MRTLLPSSDVQALADSGRFGIVVYALFGPGNYSPLPLRPMGSRPKRKSHTKRRVWPEDPVWVHSQLVDAIETIREHDAPGHGFKFFARTLDGQTLFKSWEPGDRKYLARDLRRRPSPKKRAALSRKIRVLHHEGYPHKQAIAIGHRMLAKKPKAKSRKPKKRRS
jgi:hypothetical protein